MKKLLVTFFILLLSNSVAQAIFSEDYTNLDLRFIEPPEKNIPSLNNRVNFTFKNTNLSQIFLMLSKAGDFNIIFPDKYDKPIDIVINELKLKDAIYDICKLAGLDYEFKGSSLVIYKSDIHGLDFAAIPIAYFKAGDIANHLNDHLFHQIIITQDANNLRPYAVEDPSKNSVVVFGSEEHIKAAQRLVEQIDIAPKVKIYSPRNLSTKEVKKILQVYFTDNFLIDVKKIEENDILIKGSSKVVDDAVKLISSLDRPMTNISLRMEIYVSKSNKEDLIEHTIKVADDKGLKKYFLCNTEAELDVMDLFDKKDTLVFELVSGSPVQIQGMSIGGERSLIDPNKVLISGFGQNLSAVAEENSVYKILDENELRNYKELKGYSSKKHPYVLVNFVIEQ